MLQKFLKFASNFLGWRTNRKIVVLESDDWGSIRMPSLKAYNELAKFGINLSTGDNARFNTLDTLASKTDLEMLFETLRRHRDKNGCHPVFTAMSLPANPDFEKIQQAKFTEYFFEPFTTTLKRYGLDDSFTLWKQGEQENLFYPEFHGREHLNIKVWMDDLQNCKQHTLEGFKLGVWGFRNMNASGISYQAAFDLDTKAMLPIQKGVIESGLHMFEQLHGRRARYFVPPNGAINQDVIDFSVQNGIMYVSTPKIHNEPQGGGRKRKRYRYLGMTGKAGMIYLTRNCFFEPSFKGRGFSAADCLEHIRTAFMLRKPAVISTHRVNYVGGLSLENRVHGNRELDALLKKILYLWPEVEFMTSVQLGDLIRNDKE